MTTLIGRTLIILAFVVMALAAWQCVEIRPAAASACCSSNLDCNAPRPYCCLPPDGPACNPAGTEGYCYTQPCI